MRFFWFIVFIILTSRPVFTAPFTEQTVITRFSRHPDYFSGHRHWLGQDPHTLKWQSLGGGFLKLVRRSSAEKGKCLELVLGPSLFALARMQQEDYISPSVVEEFKFFFRTLNPDQMTVFERARWEPLPDGPFHLPPEAYLDVHISKDHRRWARMREATFWMVLGQAEQSNKGNLKQVQFELPWEKDPGFSHARLDRNRYRVVVEFGRGAQLKHPQAIDLFRFPVAHAYWEAKSLGVAPSDVTVFVMSKKKEWTRLFQKLLGVTLFATSSINSSEVVQTTTLDKLLLKFPPTGVAQVDEAIRLSDDRLTPTQALDLLGDLQGAYRMDLDTVLSPFPQRDDQPIVIRDLSGGANRKAQAILKKFGLDDSLTEAYLTLIDHFRNSQIDGLPEKFATNFPGAIRPNTHEVFVTNLELDRGKYSLSYLRWLALAIQDFYRKEVGCLANFTFSSFRLPFVVSGDKILGSPENIYMAPFLGNPRPFENGPELINWDSGANVESVTVGWPAMDQLQRTPNDISQPPYGALQNGFWQRELLRRNLFNY